MWGRNYLVDFIDISRMIDESTTVYPGDPHPRLVALSVIGENSPFSLTAIENMTTHLGTHIDAPAHFHRDGMTLDSIALRRFQGPALVIAVDGFEVTVRDVPEDIEGMNVLFRTRNSAYSTNADFRSDYVHLTEDAADILARRKVNLVGIDYLSVDSADTSTFAVHNRLLMSDILILEGLDLSRAEPGRYYLFAFPLKISRADGSPVRAVLTTIALP